MPPDPPGWVKAVEAVAKIDSRERPCRHRQCAERHTQIAGKGAQGSDGDVSRGERKRHELLRKMRPEWRQIEQTLDKVGKNVDSLLGRSVTIDRHMEEYEDIVKGEDHAISILSSSSLVYFFVSALVLVIAIGGATVNFSLIARPMAEMVGGTSMIGGFKTAESPLSSLSWWRSPWACS